MTLKDIAEKAGVSMMTVSNVVNGKTGRVSPQTREKVARIIEECGYTPNLNARSLTNKVSNIIGVIISAYEDETANYLDNPYTSTMIGVIERELRQSGYYIMLRSIKQGTDLTAMLKNWNVDGMIFLEPVHQAEIEKLMKITPCPIAVFDSSLDLDGLINICSDDKKGMYLSTKYMINHGHKHIAFVADCQNSHVLIHRFEGYRQALEECHIPFREELVYAVPPNYEGGLEAGKRIASDYGLEITAAVTTADICAIGIMEGARLGGYRIPIDLSVIGYDNLFLGQYTTPKLTTISQNIPQKALTATQLLLEKIRTGTTASPSHAVMDVEIIERQSVISLF